MTALTPALAKKILRDREAGDSHRQIAIRYHITKAQSQGVIHRARSGCKQLGAGNVRPWSEEDLARLEAMAAAWTPIQHMTRALRTSERRVRAKLTELRGEPYVRPSDIVRSERRGNLSATKAEQVGRHPNDHLAHCLAVIRANNGCGFPAYDLPPTRRIAA